MTFVHKTPTHEITTPVLPADYKHPAGLTCGRCGGTFNSSFAFSSHADRCASVERFNSNYSRQFDD